jgi:hypothetical protein
MAIEVKPLNTRFTVAIEHEEEKVTFIFSQLSYKTKSYIGSMCSRVEQGKFIEDGGLKIFYNLKHGLKSVKGLVDAEGKPYKLKFEDREKTALTDECLEEILATPLSDKMQFAALELSKTMLPNEIKHPLTGKKIEGVEVVPTDGVKKNS